MIKKQSQKPNNLVVTLFFSVLIGFLALFLAVILGDPRIAMSEQNAALVFYILAGIFVILVFLSTFTRSPKIIDGQLIVRGIYKYVRYPLYGAIVFVLFPALAIWLRSWILLAAVFLIYFLCRAAVKKEDKELAAFFGDPLRYKKNVWPLFPNLFVINRYVLFGVFALIVFLTVFVILNSSILYSGLVSWSGAKSAVVENNSIATINEGLSGDLPEAKPKPRYDKPDSIVIEKLGVNAPLVLAQSTKDADLNNALNQGVVVYPGSKMPGQPGEVFLSGHSSTYIWNRTPYGKVFATLNNLEAGDLITIYFNGYKYDYRVTGKTIVEPEESVLNPLMDLKTLTLSTCWPIGTSKQRLLVQAKENE